MGGDWGTVHQIVVPVGYRQHVLELAHEHWWFGHLSVGKMYDQVLKYLFWPGMKTNVVCFCKTCYTCQIVGKPNQVVPPVPLHPVPAVGETAECHCKLCSPISQNEVWKTILLTVMCVATCFPEAIPL